MNDNVLSIRQSARRAITRAGTEVPPLLQIFDDLGIRRKDVAEVCGVPLPSVSAWGARTVAIPKKHLITLYNAALGAIAAAVETLGETAADHPDLITSEGFRAYALKTGRARRLIVEIAKELDQGHDHGETQQG